MLLRTLLARDSSAADVDLSFHTRGAEVSRLEGFSDAVFGFAITLLVISAKAPDSSTELLAMRHAVLPFVASFAVLFGLWRAQFNFFRRFGLEDRRTIRLTGMLLMIVLLGVYPVKFLMTFFLDVLPVALARGDNSMKAVMPIEALPKVLLLYAVGFAGVTFVFARLYRHAAVQYLSPALSELELFDTRAIERRWLGMSTMGVAIGVWCLLMLTMRSHTAQRDIIWNLGYDIGLVIVAGTGVFQRRAIRRLARERADLVRGSTQTAGILAPAA